MKRERERSTAEGVSGSAGDGDQGSPLRKGKKQRLEDLLFGDSNPPPRSVADLPEPLLLGILECVNLQASRTRRRRRRGNDPRGSAEGRTRVTQTERHELRQPAAGGFVHALVCRRWHKLSFLAQSAVQVRANAMLPWKLLVSQLARFPSLTSISLGFCSVDSVSDQLLDDVTSRWPRLKDLRLHEMTGFLNSRVTSAGISRVFRHCQGLTSLVLCQASKTPYSIPEDVSSLQELRTLQLGSNDFNPIVSSLPHTMGLLKNLTKLHIQSSALLSLPPSLGSLPSLRSLTLMAKVLQELPESVGQLSSLSSLHVSSEALREIPSSVSRLTGLKFLHLEGSGLLRLPENLQGLSSLKSLDISRCLSLRGLPDSFTMLTSLTSLSAGPGLHTVGQGMGAFQALAVLRIRVYRAVALPDSVCDLRRLRELHISLSSIETLPERLGESMVSLEKLTLSHCHRLRGVPESLTQLSALKELRLDGLAQLEVSSAIHSLIKSLKSTSSES